MTATGKNAIAMQIDGTVKEVLAADEISGVVKSEAAIVLIEIARCSPG